MIRASPMASTTTATAKIELSDGLMVRHITTLMMSIIGGRTAMRMIIWNAFWILVTSVVIRVIRPAVENLSIFAKEKVWILSYMLRRRFAANPVDA